LNQVPDPERAKARALLCGSFGNGNAPSPGTKAPAAEVVAGVTFVNGWANICYWPDLRKTWVKYNI
jgi:hypothetical protein